MFIGARNRDAGARAVQHLAGEGGQAAFLCLDVGQTDSIRAAAGDFAKHSDRLDVLINNAGIYEDEGRDILRIGRKELDATFQTNVYGPVEVAQAFLPFLKKSKAGRIINLSSGYGQLDGLGPGVPAYCLSKLTLNGVTLMLSQAVRGEGIAVNSMCPGWVRTDMGGPNAPRSVEQGADTAVWLASEASQELTGKFFRDRQEIAW